MRFSTAASFALAAPLFASAAPLYRRQSSLSPAQQTDLTVIDFANILNQLELNFYMSVSQRFSQLDITNAGFPNAQLLQQQIANAMVDEGNHIQAFEAVITSFGQQPLGGCQFDFGSAISDLPTALATARVVENLGVSAFLGVANLVSDPGLLTDAASVLTVEARHSTIMNILSGTGQAIPQAFDIPLNPQSILATAGQFISGCNLGIQGNAPLAIGNAPLSQGSQIQLNSTAISGDTSNLSCQMIVGGASQATVEPFQSCIVPSNITGPVAIFVTNSSTPLDADVTKQDNSIVLAGPVMTFIDTTPQTLGTLARNVGQQALPSPSSSSSGSSLGSSSSNSTSSTGVTVNSSNGTTSVSGATSSASSPCGANPADTNNAVSLGGPNTYTGPSANCVFTISPITNQSTLTASPFVNDTTVSGTVAPTAPAAAVATGALTTGSSSSGAVLTSSVASALTTSSTNA
jgi:hypothetical protein